MPQVLTDIEARILGSLIEKSLTTPDQYPLSLHGLVTACNQISNREPLMNLDETAIARSLATLQERGFVTRRSEPGSRVTKFQHHVENLLKGGTSKEVGAICVMLLRGPQTAGQIKTRTERLCEFNGPAEVEQVLQDLATRADEPFVVRLPRQPGQKEVRYMHLFSGQPADQAKAAPHAPAAPIPMKTPPASPPLSDRYQQLEKRIEALEKDVASLKNRTA
jgi:uncharacterized protein YceH (UPF0502 family)